MKPKSQRELSEVRATILRLVADSREYSARDIYAAIPDRPEVHLRSILCAMLSVGQLEGFRRNELSPSPIPIRRKRMFYRITQKGQEALTQHQAQVK